MLLSIGKQYRFEQKTYRLNMVLMGYAQNIWNSSKATNFCSTLTSIQQHDVNNAPSYAEAVTHFKRWLYQYDDFVFCSWGDYDKSQLEQDSQFHNIGFPVGAEHWNIKKAFSNTQHLSRTYGMAGALKMAGLELTGTHHRGIDDVRNMVKLMPYILGRQQLNS